MGQTDTRGDKWGSKTNGEQYKLGRNTNGEQGARQTVQQYKRGEQDKLWQIQ